MWLTASLLVQVLYASPLITLSDYQRPDWFQLLLFLYRLIGRVGAVPAGYLVSALLATVTGRLGWTSLPTARLMTVLALLCIPLTGVSVLFVPSSAFLLPPPLCLCLVPYYVGVTALVRFSQVRELAGVQPSENHSPSARRRTFTYT